MTRVLCLLAVGVATAAVAAPVPKSLRKKPDYFPTPLGGVWTYGTGEDPTRHSIHISDVQTAPGETTAVRRYQMGNSEGPLDVCRVSSGEVRQVRRSSHDTAIDRLFLRPSLKPGDTWKSEYQLAEILDVRETFTVGEPQRVTVPAGTFTAVPITFRNTEGRERGRADSRAWAGSRGRGLG